MGMADPESEGMGSLSLCVCVGEKMKQTQWTGCNTDLICMCIYNIQKP